MEFGHKRKRPEKASGAHAHAHAHAHARARAHTYTQTWPELARQCLTVVNMYTSFGTVNTSDTMRWLRGYPPRELSTCLDLLAVLATHPLSAWLQLLYHKLAPMIEQQRRERHIKAVWMTMPPGHPDCGSATRPFRSYAEFHDMEARWGSATWQQAELFDAFLIPRMRQLQVPILTVKPLWLRPDAHVFAGNNPGKADCLHWGGPIGALHVVARFLQQLLEQGL